MKLSTPSNISNAYKSINSLLIQIDLMKEMGFNTISLEKETETALNYLINYLESFPVNKDYLGDHRFNMVLVEEEWITVDIFGLNNQEGCYWGINGNDKVSAKSGVSRFGQFSKDIHYDNKPCIDLTIADIRKHAKHADFF
jgi:hypothetical protein